MPAFDYLALGDSYTIGESVLAEERWPAQLAKLLQAEGIQVNVNIIARTGWTVDELWEAIQTSPPENRYDLVSLLIGVNNQYRGYPLSSYTEDFRFMLGKAIEYGRGKPSRVIVLSIPDWGVTPFASGRDLKQIADEIDQFNLANREESSKAGVHYVDITPVSRHALNDIELIATDRLHPSGKMYAIWAEMALPVARAILVHSKKERP